MSKAKSRATDDKRTTGKRNVTSTGRPSALVDTRIIYCGDCLDQLRRLPDGWVDLIYIDPPFNSNRNYEVFWGEAREKRAFEDHHTPRRLQNHWCCIHIIDNRSLLDNPDKHGYVLNEKTYTSQRGKSRQWI
ncbi:MAG: hypothetical protein HOP29_18370 [Phycisphaerales bacterium]|nr:hypothetical protein [Phycisphaerales bacterium]